MDLEVTFRIAMASKNWRTRVDQLPPSFRISQLLAGRHTDKNYVINHMISSSQLRPNALDREGTLLNGPTGIETSSRLTLATFAR